MAVNKCLKVLKEGHSFRVRKKWKDLFKLKTPQHPEKIQHHLQQLKEAEIDKFT